MTNIYDKDEKVIRRVIENILFKSTTDRKYRDYCIADGLKAFEKESGFKLSNSINIIFIEGRTKEAADIFEGDGKSILFILPDFVGDLAELTNIELEAVYGGAALSLDIGNNRHAVDSLVRKFLESKIDNRLKI